jgi:hypothetical protein
MQGEQLGPGDQFGGEGDQLEPDLVLSGSLQCAVLDCPDVFELARI